MSRVNFARDYLACQGYTIFQGHNEILIPVNPHDKYMLDRVGFWATTSEVLRPRKIFDMTTISQIENLGYGVESVPVREKYRKRQSKEYKLTRLSKRKANFIKSLRSDHRVQMDTANEQIRLVGPNAGPNWAGDWENIKLVNPKGKHKPNGFFEIMQQKEKVLKDFKHSLYGTKERNFIDILEIPFMVTDSGKVICIPPLRDQPRIGVWGTSGNGKTMLMHALMDRAKWNPQFKVCPIFINDTKPDTPEWCMPFTEYEDDLARYKETPKPLPMVYLHPNTKDMGRVIHEKWGIGYKLSLPFTDIITNFHKYFDFKGSGKYFSFKRDEFNECKTVDEIIEVFIQPFGPEESVPQKTSISMVRASLEAMKEFGILDIWTDVPSKWVVMKDSKIVGEYNPLLACALTGLVPSLITTNIIEKEYFPQYFQYFSNEIFITQMEDDLFYDNGITIWVVMDEILTVCGDKGKATPASRAFERLQTEGRQRRIGTIVSTQNYSYVPFRVRTNCNYVIAFNSAGESNKICSENGIKPEFVKQMHKLERFECMAYAKDEHFVVYDSEGRRTEEKGPFFGKILWPLSKHTPPGKAVV